MTCERRKEHGKLAAGDDQDAWSTDRWPTHPRLKTMRTCSFCGSVHPDDALQLLREGWEHGRTNKPYKGYIELPGNEAYAAAFMAAMQDGALEGKRPFPEHVCGADMLMTGMPPVKFYIQHFELEQVRELNALIKEGADKMYGVGL